MEGRINGRKGSGKTEENIYRKDYRNDWMQWVLTYKYLSTKYGGLEFSL